VTAASALEERMVGTVLRPPPWYRPAVALLLAVIAWGVYAWSVQLRSGFVVTGLHDRVPWGAYVVTFIFLIGISHAGTLISAILRLSGAEWRRPITRMAEVITAVALMTGAAMILVDVGRPDRIGNILRYGFGNLRSPIIWDVLSISTYLTGSLIYLYIPMIPDVALLRDRLAGSVSPGHQRLHRVYQALALGWHGTSRQHERLERGLKVMTILIIPIAVSVYTVVSFIFAMTLRPGWHSSIFGPYFVVGAIFSGIGGIIVAMAIFRRAFRLEPWITRDHFRKLGALLLALNLVYLYFTFAEYLTAGYQVGEAEGHLLAALFTGEYAAPFWFFVIAGLLVPAFLCSFQRTRTVAGITVAAILVNLGMWLKRYLIVVPSLTVAQTPTEGVIGYQPTWVEWSIVAAAFAGFVLLYLVFSRFFPVISVWEVEEVAEVEADVRVPARRRIPVASAAAATIRGGRAE
jgi:Ni/Fe-hydrogenase subunit HybB-like protein